MLAFNSANPSQLLRFYLSFRLCAFSQSSIVKLAAGYPSAVCKGLHVPSVKDHKHNLKRLPDTICGRVQGASNRRDSVWSAGYVSTTQ